MPRLTIKRALWNYLCLFALALPFQLLIKIEHEASWPGFAFGTVAAWLIVGTAMNLILFAAGEQSEARMRVCQANKESLSELSR